MNDLSSVINVLDFAKSTTSLILKNTNIIKNRKRSIEIVSYPDIYENIDSNDVEVFAVNKHVKPCIILRRLEIKVYQKVKVATRSLSKKPKYMLIYLYTLKIDNTYEKPKAIKLGEPTDVCTINIKSVETEIANELTKQTNLIGRSITYKNSTTQVSDITNKYVIFAVYHENLDGDTDKFYEKQIYCGQGRFFDNEPTFKLKQEHDKNESERQKKYNEIEKSMN